MLIVHVVRCSPDLSQDTLVQVRYVSATVAFVATFIAAFGLWRDRVAKRRHWQLLRKLENEALPVAMTAMQAPISPEELNSFLTRSLLESFERERLIADYAVTVLLSVDSLFMILSATPSITRQWRYPVSAITGSSIADLIFSADLKLVESRLQSAVESVEHSAVFDCRILAQDRAVRDTTWTVEYSPSESRFFCALLDVTELRAAERTKKLLLQMIGHDLRVPVSAAQFALRSISCSESLTDGGQRMLSSLETSLSRVLRLSSDMLDLQLCEEGQLALRLQVVALKQLIEEVLEEQGESLVAHGKVVLKNLAEVFVRADEDRLKQVLANLIANAVKYSARGATIRLTTRVLLREVELRIDDSGDGEPICDYSLLFNPYVRLGDGQSKGTGLGLVLSRELVIAQGGEIGVGPSDLGGLSFWVSLPRAEL